MIPKNKTKVLIISDFQAFGGIKTFFFHQVKFYLKNNFEVVVLLKAHQRNDELLDFFKNYKIDYLLFSQKRLHKTIRLFGKDITYFLNFFLEFWQFFNILMKSGSKLVVHSGGQFYYSIFLFPIKLIYYVHTSPDSFIDKWSCNILKKFTGNQKKILTVSKSCKSDIVKYWRLDQKSVSVIYNFHPTLKERIKPKNKTKITILTLGHLETYKNPHFWIDVAKVVIKKNPASLVEFIWAGDGSLLQECITMASDNKSIRFIGYQKDIAYLYSLSDIYFQPSLKESHGISVLGAMAAKRPCVVANIGGMPESVVHYETGFVYESDNLNQAVDYLDQLIENKKLSDKLGFNGYTRYQKHFTSEVWENKMKSYLKKNFNV
jgi:glycosyltransferase involved in cell wall biosynthesis